MASRHHLAMPLAILSWIAVWAASMGGCGVLASPLLLVPLLAPILRRSKLLLMLSSAPAVNVGLGFAAGLHDYSTGAATNWKRAIDAGRRVNLDPHYRVYDFNRGCLVTPDQGLSDWARARGLRFPTLVRGPIEGAYLGPILSSDEAFARVLADLATAALAEESILPAEPSSPVLPFEIDSAKAYWQPFPDPGSQVFWTTDGAWAAVAYVTMAGVNVVQFDPGTGVVFRGDFIHLPSRELLRLSKIQLAADQLRPPSEP